MVAEKDPVFTGHQFGTDLLQRNFQGQCIYFPNKTCHGSLVPLPHFPEKLCGEGLLATTLLLCLWQWMCEDKKKAFLFACPNLERPSFQLSAFTETLTQTLQIENVSRNFCGNFAGMWQTNGSSHGEGPFLSWNTLLFTTPTI